MMEMKNLPLDILRQPLEDRGGSSLPLRNHGLFPAKKKNGPQISTLGTILRNPFLLFGSLNFWTVKKLKKTSYFSKSCKYQTPK